MPYSEFPAIVKPITPEVFVQLAMLIETGTALAKKSMTDPAVDRFEPGYTALAAPLYDYIPLSYIPLGPGPPPLYVCHPNVTPCQQVFGDDDRSGIATFQLGRDALMEALIKATPPSTLQQLGDISGANAPGPEGGMNWWVTAIGLGGFLSWIGKSKVIGKLVTLTDRKRLILALGAGLLYVLGTTGAVSEVLPAAKKAAGDLFHQIVIKPAETAGSVLAVVLGLGVAVVGATLIYNFTQNNRRKTSQAIAA